METAGKSEKGKIFSLQRFLDDLCLNTLNVIGSSKTIFILIFFKSLAHYSNSYEYFRLKSLQPSNKGRDFESFSVNILFKERLLQPFSANRYILRVFLGGFSWPFSNNSRLRSNITGFKGVTRGWLVM